MKKKTLGQAGKNKAKQSQTKPIQTQSKPIPEKLKMNVTSIITKGYDNKSLFATIEKQTQYKPNQRQFQRQKNAAAYDDYRPFIGIDYRRQII